MSTPPSNAMKTALALTLAYSILDVMAKASESLFTCKAGNFSLGHPGSVTCYFGPSIHSKDYHIEVNHYPFDASDSDSGDTVLQCYRTTQDLQCTAKTGFEFNNQIQANLTVTIPVVQTQFAGRYTCQLIPPDGREPEFCHLHVEESVPEAGEGHVCHSTQDLVLAVFVGILVVLCIIFVPLFIYRKCRRRLRKLFVSFRGTLNNPAKGQATKSHLVEDEEIRVPFIMSPIVPYPESEEDSEPDDRHEKKVLDGDEEDARQPYTINISLDYKVDYDQEAGESPGKIIYSWDQYDRGRKPVKITIQPFDETYDDGGDDQHGYLPLYWRNQRQPFRRPWSMETHA